MASPAADVSTPTHNNGIMPVAVSVGTVSLALVLVLARLYTRTCIVKQVGADDWTILVAWVCLSMLCLFGLASPLHVVSSFKDRGLIKADTGIQLRCRN
jgi:hypothetical protein